MRKPEIKSIKIENLLIDLKNPRYDPKTNQREAIANIANDQGVKLANLAEDIVERGLNPSELPIVAPSGDADTFIVVEGNRRLTALKLLLSPSLAASLGLPNKIAKRYKELHEIAKSTLPTNIICAILSREDANHWIYLRHTGENQGVGIVPWDGLQTQRFRGSSPSLQAVEFVRNSDYIDESTRKKLPKIAITNVERILGTPDARKLLGVDVKNGQLLFTVPDEEAIARLSIVIRDIANKDIKVSDLDTKAQRVEYAKEVASSPLPTAKTKSKSDDKDSESTEEQTSKTQKQHRPDRKFLIPKRLKLAIPQTRINKIYHELQQLDVKKFVNSCAVMLRVFIELSVDDYAQRHGISLVKTIPARTNSKGKYIPETELDLNLREKLRTVADYLDKNDICTKAELQGVRMIVSKKDHVLSVDSLNAYVHNKDLNPSDTDLKITWDNLEVFVQRIWST